MKLQDTVYIPETLAPDVDPLLDVDFESEQTNGKHQELGNSNRPGGTGLAPPPPHLLLSSILPPPPPSCKGGASSSSTRRTPNFPRHDMMMMDLLRK